MSDIDRLICEAREGRREALDELIERYRPFVQLVVRCRSRGQLRARLGSSDMVQETMLRVAEGIGQFQGEGEAEWRAWLGRIAEREVIRHLRLHVGAEKRAVGRERRVAASASDSLTGSRHLDQWLVNTQTSPSMVAMRHERALWLSDALSRLQDDYREVLILRHIEGLDFPEIARRMNRTPGATRVLWVRALRKLRETISNASHVIET